MAVLGRGGGGFWLFLPEFCLFSPQHRAQGDGWALVPLLVALGVQAPKNNLKITLVLCSGAVVYSLQRFEVFLSLWGWLSLPECGNP